MGDSNTKPLTAADYRPSSLDEALEVMNGEPDRPILPIGAGTKRALYGQSPVSTMDMRGLCGILDYQPADFTITVASGTPIAQVVDRLSESSQFFPFDPPRIDRGATVGGMVASGWNGPGRMLWGGLRDFILSVEFIDGLGKHVRGGARVVKNSAGFDLPKFMVGSLGRFGILTSVTFKVFPVPRGYRTWIIDTGSIANALTLLAGMARIPLELTAIDFEPTGRVYLRGVGADEVLEATEARLSSLKGCSHWSTIEKDRESEFWKERRDEPLEVESLETVDLDPETRRISANSLIKLAIRPSQALEIDRELEVMGVMRTYSHAGNTLWIRWPDRLGSEPIVEWVKRFSASGLVIDGPSKEILFLRDEESRFLFRVKKGLDPRSKMPGW